MSQDDLEPLDSDLEDLLKIERARPGGTPEVMARVFSRVETSIAALPALPDGGGGGTGGTGGSEGATILASGAPQAAATIGATGLMGAKLALVTALSFALGAGTGAFVYSATVEPPPAEVKVVEKIVEVPVAAKAPELVPQAVLEVQDEKTDSPPVRPQAPSVGGPRGTPDPSPSEPAGRERDRLLSEENLLIARAQAALSQKQVGAALEALRLHAAKFPNGQLRPERELMLREAERMAASP